MYKSAAVLMSLILGCLLQSACIHTLETRRDPIPDEEKVAFDQRTRLSDKELIMKARDEGLVRIIIRLNMEFVPEGKLNSPKEILAQRQMIANQQKEVLKVLRDHKISRVKRLRFAPSLAMTVDERAMSVLLEQGHLIEYIELDLLRHRYLTDSRPLIGAERAAELGYRGGSWVIAILDTGVDKTHDFLSSKVIAEACFSDNLCPNGANEEHGSGTGVNCSTSIAGCDHGTHVAGIAAGWGGTAQYSFLLSIQVFSRIDSDVTCLGHRLSAPCILSYDSDQLSALDWLYGHTYNLLGVPVSSPIYSLAAVNMSLGAGRHYAACDKTSRKDAIDNLRFVGVATVIASGNEGYPDSIGSPACISSAISVGATRKTDGIAAYSNRSDFMSLWAPGTNINSSVPGGSFAEMSGTSMAAPHVAGAFAILRDASPNYMGAEIVNDLLSALQTTGRQISQSPSTSTTRIQIDAAIEAL